MTGAAGVHLLAGLISAMNLPVAISQKNVPDVDLFVGSEAGAAVAIQVKTMRSAHRRARGQYEWRCKPTRLEKGFYAFIDLRQKRNEDMLSIFPDVFLVPVRVVRNWKHYPPHESFVKPTERELAKYKNEKGWNLLFQALGKPAETVPVLVGS